jgi:phospholipase/carboxylesterase
MQHSIVLEPAQAVQYSVIWLHGLGASGNDFASLVPHLGLPDNHTIRFIFPHAPEQAVTINGGMRMPSWYDITKISAAREINSAQFQSSVARVQLIIDSQISGGIASRNIIIAGFSQGGAVAYNAALTYSQPLAGVLALSTYIADELVVSSANNNTPLELFHGEQDSVVPFFLGKAAHDQLQALGLAPKLHSYVMDHEVCSQQIADISAVLQEWCGYN